MLRRYQIRDTHCNQAPTLQLTSGTEVTVAEVPKPSGGSMSLSIAATIQD